MRNRILLIVLLLASAVALAQETAGAAAAASKPNPPRWRYGIRVQTVIGADVASGLDSQLAPASLILRILDLSQLPGLPAGATECVFEATAWSNLASERVIVRPNMLRCHDAQGKEFAGRTVSGFGVDKDARFGIKSPQLWSPTAKELLFMGAGAQSKSSFITRRLSSAASVASLGLSEELTSSDESKRSANSPDGVRDIRSMDTLLPTLTLEPGGEFDIVLQGTRP
jgi:hypothetical protein